MLDMVNASSASVEEDIAMICRCWLRGRIPLYSTTGLPGSGCASDNRHRGIVVHFCDFEHILNSQ